MYINFTYLEKKGLKLGDLLVMIMIHQKETDLMRGMKDYTPERLFSRLMVDENLTFIKGTNKQDKFDRVRLSKKGKALLLRLQVYDYTEATEKLCEALCDLYESYDREAGNKRRIIENLTWFLGKTTFEHEQILESVEDFITTLIDDSKEKFISRLENLLWDKKKSTVFVTMTSRDLSQSPLHEFMRRKYKMQY